MATTRTTFISFLRNEKLYGSKKEAKEGLKNAAIKNCTGGSMILARYFDNTDNDIKTLLGIIYSKGSIKSISIFESDDILLDNDNIYDDINQDNLYYGNIYRKYLYNLSKMALFLASLFIIIG